MLRAWWIKVMVAASLVGIIALVSNITTTSQLSGEAETMLTLRLTVSKLVNSATVWGGLLFLAGWFVRRPLHAALAGVVAGEVALGRWQFVVDSAADGGCGVSCRVPQGSTRAGPDTEATYGGESAPRRTVIRTDQAGRSQGGNIMLSDFTPMTTLGVKDLETARRFYESVLGFTAPTDVGEGAFYTAGNSRFFIYRSQYAGTNQATAMSFQIPADTFDAEVAGLRAAGVTFDTFDAPGVTWDDGVATIGEGMRGVWFKDPDGNILNVDTGLR